MTLVGGAPVVPGTLEVALGIAPRLVAVDGGADTVLRSDRFPEAVIGDMDSISPEARYAFADCLVREAEQDSTDFEKALRAFPASLTVAVGFLGARADHFLACLSVLARRRAACILLGETDCVAIAPRHLSLDLAPGTRVSLWPLGPGTGSSRGLRWPIDGLALSPDGRVSTSNEATGPVHLRLSGGPMALILPADAIGALIRGLGWGGVTGE